MKQPLPRGLQNHNPGNIRHSAEKWQGEVQPSTDPEFKQFVSDAYGYRALLKLISNYITRYGCTTLRRVIARWAPPSENIRTRM